MNIFFISEKKENWVFENWVFDSGEQRVGGLIEGEALSHRKRMLGVSAFSDAASLEGNRPPGGANPAQFMHMKTKLASKLQIKTGSASVPFSTAVLQLKTPN